SLIKNNVNGGNGLSINKQVNYVPQSFTESDSQAMTAADAFNKVSPAVVIISTVGTSSNGFTASQYEGMGSGFIIPFVRVYAKFLESGVPIAITSAPGYNSSESPSSATAGTFVPSFNLIM
ncbi:Protease do, partial [human gut metagenome]